MKVLVYGAGPLGSVFAARLHEAGHEVSLLARGQRLADLREHGVVLVDTQTGQETVARPWIVERLDPQDAYDLVLVIMRKNRALEILPTLAANRHTPNILFLMNNAAGPGELVQALGAEWVMIGFPAGCAGCDWYGCALDIKMAKNLSENPVADASPCVGRLMVGRER